MASLVSTATGYRNLQSYSHVYQPVSSIQTTTDSIGYDPAQYRKVIQLDMEETERDNLWIREEIRRVLIQNELLRHRFRYSQADEERRRNFELERRQREEEERRRWEEEMERRHLEDEDRRRFEDEQRRRQDEERHRLDEERRRLEAERRQLEEEEKRKIQDAQQKTQAMGRFPDPADIITVFVLRGDDLRQAGRYAPLYCKVGFDGQPTLPYRTKSAGNSGEPIWEETLPEMYMPNGARNLVVEVYEDESRDDLIGTGHLDLRSEENEVHPIQIVNHAGQRQGKVYLRYNSRHQPPPPPPPVAVPPPAAPAAVPGRSTLDLDVIKARDLLDLDMFGKSEPYVKLHWGMDPKPFFTTKPMKGKNPVWNEGVKRLEVPNDVDFVNIMVYDEDVGKDEFMGCHRLKLLPPPDGEFWLPLHVRDGEPADAKLAKKGPLGDINVRAHYVHVPGHGGPSGTISAGPRPAVVPTKCKLTVFSGEGLAPADLNGFSDPYTTVSIGSQPSQKKTSVKKKTLAPTWDETFDLVVPEDENYITFNVFDDDKIGADDFLGQGILDVRAASRTSGSYKLNLQPRANNSADEKLASKHSGLGVLRVKTEWIMPAAAPPPPPPAPSYEEVETW